MMITLNFVEVVFINYLKWLALNSIKFNFKDKIASKSMFLVKWLLHKNYYDSTLPYHKTMCRFLHSDA